MEILEKFKKYIDVFVIFLKLRFNPFRYIILSVLILMLSVSSLNGLFSNTSYHDFLFIFISLFVFRFIDDLASYRFDRIINPEREYLTNDNFKAFIIITLILVIFYFISNIFWFGHWEILTIFIMLISVLYLLYLENTKAVTVIQILKYPIFLFCINSYSVSIDSLLVYIGLYALLLSNDFFELYPTYIHKKRIYTIAHYTTLIFIGMMIVQPFYQTIHFTLYSIVILIPIPLIYLKKYSHTNELPIVIYPIIKLLITKILI